MALVNNVFLSSVCSCVDFCPDRRAVESNRPDWCLWLWAPLILMWNLFRPKDGNCSPRIHDRVFAREADCRRCRPRSSRLSAATNQYRVNFFSG